MDQEFDKIESDAPMEINTTGAKEHVAEIERQIKMIKDRARATLLEVPFRMLPKQMVVHLIYFVCHWIYAWPNKNGVSRIYTPKEMARKSTLSLDKHCMGRSGQYVGKQRQRGH